MTILPEEDIIDAVKWQDLITSLPDSVHEVVDAYLEDSPPAVDEIEAAWRSGNLFLCERRAHALKSSSGIFGLKRLMLLCYAIEMAARRGDPSLAEKVAELRGIHAQAVEVIKRKLRESR